MVFAADVIRETVEEEEKVGAAVEEPGVASLAAVGVGARLRVFFGGRGTPPASLKLAPLRLFSRVLGSCNPGVCGVDVVAVANVARDGEAVDNGVDAVDGAVVIPTTPDMGAAKAGTTAGALAREVAAPTGADAVVTCASSLSPPWVAPVCSCTRHLLH